MFETSGKQDTYRIETKLKNYMKRALKKFRIINYMKFSFEFKKPIFGPFQQILTRKSFSKKLGCHAQLHKGF